MRTNLINKIKEDYKQWLQYGVIFDTPDTGDIECELELVLEEDGVKVWLEYEFGTIFIAGLTDEEQKYLEK